jgi:hypothetical protein
MKRPWLVIALLLSVGINIGILAMVGTAQGRHRGLRQEGSFRGHEAPDSQWPPVERLAERLGLEGDNLDRFVEQQQAFYGIYQQRRQDLRVVRQSLRREVSASAPDQQNIEELLAETARLTAELNRAFVENVLATRGLLDDSQERAYFGMLERLRERGESRWQRGEGPPGRDGRRRGPPGM